MSRTLEDLIGALEPPTAPERVTPDPTTFLRENARRRAARSTRRKTLAVVGTTLSVAIVVSLPVVLAHPGRGQAPAADPAPSASLAPSESAAPTSAPAAPARLVYQQTLRDTTTSDGYEISPWYVDVTYQEARVLPPVGGGPKPQGSVHVYEPGYYDPSQVRGIGVPVSVAGTTGFYVESGPVPTNRFDTSQPLQEPLLAWEYAAGAWALVSDFDEDEAVAVANAVQLGTAEAVRLPFALSYVPARLGGVDAFTVGQPGGLGAAAWYGGTAFVVEHEKLSFGDMGLTASYTIDGHPAARTGNAFEIAFDDFGLTIHTTDQAEAEAIVAGMSFADWNDPSTYLAASS